MGPLPGLLEDWIKGQVCVNRELGSSSSVLSKDVGCEDSRMAQKTEHSNYEIEGVPNRESSMAEGTEVGVKQEYERKQIRTQDVPFWIRPRAHTVQHPVLCGASHIPMESLHA